MEKTKNPSYGERLTHNVIDRYYPKNRLTSNEEFAKDGEYTIRLKGMLFKAIEKVNRRAEQLKNGVCKEADLDYAQSVYNRVAQYTSEKSKKLKLKHWGI